MPEVQRWFLGMRNGRLNCTFNWDAVNHSSVVLVSAGEGDVDVRHLSSSRQPNRFVGAALITVHNIAPFDRGVKFVITVDWDEPLPIWVDIVLLDESPDGWVG